MHIHLLKAFFPDDQFLDSLHKSFLNQTTLDLRKEKWTFLNQEFTVPLNVNIVKEDLLNKTSFWKFYEVRSERKISIKTDSDP